MAKTFMGVKLRRLRSERGMSQIALAQALGISPSYLNQLEQNQRPLTVGVLLKLNRALGVDIQQFSEDEEARLIAGMREALTDATEPITLPELQEVANQMPALGRAIVALYRRNMEAVTQLEAMALRMGDDRTDSAAVRVTPFEAVRDFFFANKNYFDLLDRAAEAMATQAGLQGAGMAGWIEERLRSRHKIQVVQTDGSEGGKRQYDPRSKTIRIARSLDPGQQAFQLATQLAFLEAGEMLDALTNTTHFAEDAPTLKLARIGLANYFAGALVLPYGHFLEASEALRYDIDLLSQRFGVGFETVCHRLSTLQRPAAPGVPFFFVRVDRAGNISKRQSATHFHFSRTGGTCPLWNVYEAFAQPERVLPQLARMPDGRAYLWIARTVTSNSRGYGSPGKVFSIGLGCDVRHAPRLIYAKGLDLADPEAATPIGMGCKVCEREDCLQRAFPYVGRSLDIDENQSGFSPYGAASNAQKTSTKVAQ